MTTVRVHLLAFSRNTQWLCKSNLFGVVLGKQSVTLNRMRCCRQVWKRQAYKSFFTEKDYHCSTWKPTLPLGHQDAWGRLNSQTRKERDNSRNTINCCIGLRLKRNVITAQRTGLGMASQRVWHLTQVLKNEQVFSKDKWRKEFHMEGPV